MFKNCHYISISCCDSFFLCVKNSPINLCGFFKKIPARNLDHCTLHCVASSRLFVSVGSEIVTHRVFFSSWYEFEKWALASFHACSFYKIQTLIRKKIFKCYLYSNRNFILIQRRRSWVGFWQTNGIDWNQNILVVILGFPIYCLPSQILYASYATVIIY